MPALARPHGPLHYDVTDVTAPWRGVPETILFECAEAMREFLARRVP